MRVPSGLSSIFAGLLYCLATTAGSVWAQIALPAYGTINTVAGVGTSGYSGDSGPAINAEMYTPLGLAVDASGNIYIADSQNNRIRKIVAATGIITTVAGNGKAGYSGDDGPAINAELYTPQGVALDSSGNIYIADSQNNRIRKVAAATGVISTVAGNGTVGYSGDGMLAVNAELNGPSGVGLDASGNIYIADSKNNSIRKVTVSTGILTTFAGSGTAGYNGDAQPATSAELNGPQSLVVDKYGNVYVADTLNNRIREVGLAGKITTVAGTGAAGYAGDSEQANTAKISGPMGLAMDTSGKLFFADAGNMRIREVTIYTGVITTVAGNGTAGLFGDDGLAASAELNRPNGMAVDASGNLYTTDSRNNRVRVVGEDKTKTSAAAVAPLSITTPMADSSCAPGTLNLNYTNLPSYGGTWAATFQYTNLGFPGCYVGTAPLTSNVSWLLINFNTLACSPNPAANGQLVTCTIAYNVAQNTGPSRQGTITANYGSAGSVSASTLQLGPLQTLTVGVSGGGTVSSNPSGISCPSSCTTGFSLGTIVNLTPSPSPGYSFSGWSGACSGTGACSFTMTNSTSVSATFTPLPPRFTLSATWPAARLSLGHSTTSVVTVSPLYGFTGTVALSVSGLPAGVTAQLSSASINTGGIATLTLTAAYSNSTYIGDAVISVTGTSGSLLQSQGFDLVTQPLQYKGTCGVQ
jgi:trimeric autotransporter adhesin